MPTICLVAGEESGDQLGSELMKALNERLGSGVRYCGVGGERMLKLGFTSFFNMSDVSVMGLSAVLARLPLIVRRVYQTVDAIVAADPSVLVIIDSPDFTHNVASRVRKRAPHIPIVGEASKISRIRSGLVVDRSSAVAPERAMFSKPGSPR